VLKSQTRFGKLDNPDGPYAALILAKAGLLRLGYGDRVTSDIVPPTLFHAVGQGALAIEIRADDTEARSLCDALSHWQTSWRCLAERACLRVLEGGCSVPVGVHSELVPDDYSPIAAEGAGVGGGDVRAARLRLVGTITAVDGGRHVEQEIAREVRSTEEVEELGAQLARALVEAGGREILDEVAKDRERRSAGQATGTEVKNVDAAAAAARETAPSSQ
jgi:hydroxymethylbilane synthase